MTVAKIESSATVRRIITGIVGKPSERNAEKREAIETACASVIVVGVTLMASSSLSLDADSRIDRRVQQVDDEVHHDDHRPAQDDRRLDDREIAERDALVQQAA